MTSSLRNLYAHRELLWILIVRDLKIRYKSSVLGFFWSLLTPLCFIFIYAAFARILRFNDGTGTYLQFLIVGVVCWQFLSTCLNDSLHAIVGNVNLVKKTAFPRIILPLAMVLANLINFLLTVVVLVIYLGIAGIPFGPMGWLPVVLVTHLALCTGMALLISCGNVFFRDTQHVLGIVTLAWFFLTPVFYSPEFQIEHLVKYTPHGAWLAFLNPMSGILSAYRDIFMGRPHQGLGYLLVSGVVAWAILAVGIAVFQRFQHMFADEL